MARACAFCGTDEVSKEHFFARWVRDEYGDHRKHGKSTMEFARDANKLWSYSGNALDNGVRAFCKKCNNGWMSGIESRAGKLLRPMLRGKINGSIRMRHADQTSASSWAVKTALVLQQLHASESRVPESYYREFYRVQKPSSQYFVMMGTRKVAGNSNGANLFEYVDRFEATKTGGIQHIHFVVGFIYFGIAIFVDRPRKNPTRIGPAAAERCNLIWPLTTLAVDWPVLPIDDVGGVVGMFNAFVGALWG